MQELITAASKSPDKHKDKQNNKKTLETEMEKTRWYHMQQSDKMSLEKTWTWLRKGKLNKETDARQIIAYSLAVWTYYIKAKINNTQKNSKCNLCDNKIETITHISKYSKPAQKEYKSRHIWVGKVVQLELSKKLIFERNSKCYIQKARILPREWDTKKKKTLLGFETQKFI